MKGSALAASLSVRIDLAAGNGRREMAEWTLHKGSAAISASFWHGPVVQRPSIRPCQGRDRRFESGRDRQSLPSIPPTVTATSGMTAGFGRTATMRPPPMRIVSKSSADERLASLRTSALPGRREVLRQAYRCHHAALIGRGIKALQLILETAQLLAIVGLDECTPGVGVGQAFDRAAN